MSNLFYVAVDGPVFVWKRQTPGLTTVGRERFLTLPLAAAACEVVARCYCGLYRCSQCGTIYDPTFGRACPQCGAGGGNYCDALPEYQREDYIGT